MENLRGWLSLGMFCLTFLGIINWISYIWTKSDIFCQIVFTCIAVCFALFVWYSIIKEDG